jgi:hypothetical protein
MIKSAQIVGSIAANLMKDVVNIVKVGLGVREDLIRLMSSSWLGNFLSKRYGFFEYLEPSWCSTRLGVPLSTGVGGGGGFC